MCGPSREEAAKEKRPSPAFGDQHAKGRRLPHVLRAAINVPPKHVRQPQKNRRQSDHDSHHQQCLELLRQSSPVAFLRERFYPVAPAACGIARARKIVKGLSQGLTQAERQAVAAAAVDELRRDGDQWKLNEELPKGEVHSTPRGY